MAGDNAAPTETAAKGGGLLRGPVGVISLVIVVMLLEFGVLYFVLPQPAGAEAPPLETVETNAAETAEVTVDSFSTTNNIAVPGSVIHVTFKLTGITESASSLEFDTAVNQKHKARIRDVILATVRSASLEDLSDPSLATLKRRFREEVNKTLKKSLVVEFVVSEYRILEQ